MLNSICKFLSPIIKVTLFIYLLWHYGIYGIAFYIITAYLLYYVCYKYLHLHALSIGDYQFVNNDQSYKAVYILELISFDPDKIISDIYHKSFKYFPKLRQRLFYYYFDYFFVDAPLDVAKKQIKYDKDIILNSIEEINDYAHKISLLKFNENNFMYDIHIVATPNGGGVIMLNFDHVMTDGIGSMGFLNSISVTKDTHIPMSFKIPLYAWLYSILCFPYYAIMIAYRHGLYLGKVCDKHSPFKTDKPFTGITKPRYSKKYSFAKAQEFYRKMNISFNDLIISVISVTVSKYYKYYDQYKDNKKLFMTIPINVKEIPKDSRNTKMDNQASAVIIEIPIGDSLDNAEFLNKIKEEVNNTAKNLNLVYAIKFINNFGNYFLPRYIWDFMINDTLKDVDIQFSNIAGPSKPIYIGGSEVKDISFVTPIGKHRIFMGVHSYKGEYFINFNADSSIDCDVDKLVDLIDEVLEKI